MKFRTSVITILVIVFALPLLAFPQTVTRIIDIDNNKHYKTVKHTFTATTGLDTVLLQLANSTAFETTDLKVNSTVYAVHFQTAEGTAANSDFNVLWQVSSATDASNVAFPGMVIARDWVTVETDQNDDSLAWVATFDAQNYKGYKLQAVLAESSTSADAAVAIEAGVKYPTGR